MIRSAVTISLVPEARGGPFVFWDGLEHGCAEAARLRFDAVEIFPRSAAELDAGELRRAIERHALQVAAIGTGAGWVAHKLRLTDPDAAVRQKAVRFVEEIIDCAADFRAPAIIGSMQAGQIRR
jgi:sugar phosphate isomerase/epimerase